ncbi:MAG: hypothetical protein EA422_14630, partial [Gemmatimonadales bacterium]
MIRLVLVGGGHAHLHVVERIAAARAGGDRRWDRVEVVLVSAYPVHHYSGMLPGYLQGRYREEELRFDLVALARVAGIRFVRGWVRQVELLNGDPGSGSVGGGAAGAAPAGRIHTDEEVLDFHLASLDVGSVAGGTSVPGVREYAVALRPTSRAVELNERLEALRAGSAPVRAVVVGAGAAGFEVAVAVAERLTGTAATTGTGETRAAVTLVEAGPTILPEFSERVRRRGLRELARWGVRVRTGTRVTRVHRMEVRVEGEEGAVVLPSELTIWVAGAAAPPLLARSDLPLAESGFFSVNGALRAVDGAPVWGAGDCIELAGFSWMPRAGVYAVRQAPVLADNLESAVAEIGGAGHSVPSPPRSYTPQESFLSLLNTGGGRALLRWKALVALGRWPWWLK